MHMCGDIDNIIRKGEKMRLRRVHNMLIASALVCSMVVTPVFAEPGSAREEEAQLKEQNALSALYEQWSRDLKQRNKQLFEDYREALKERREKEKEESSGWW